MKFDKDVMRNIAMVTQVGISMLAPIVLCVFIGYWLDESYGWSVTLPLLILGLLAGMRNTWMLLKQLQGTEEKKHEKDFHKGKD
ncbi:MAG: AtpZ/AtpI family protein [Candidatus Limivivens sp.]|nr:AtpZ/AtpI family protein [Candidatus Limivivens sp.]